MQLSNELLSDIGYLGHKKINMTSKKKESILIEALSLKYLKIDWERAMKFRKEDPFLFYGFGALKVVISFIGLVTFAANIFIVYHNTASTVQFFISILAFLIMALGLFLLVRVGDLEEDRTKHYVGIGFALLIFSGVPWVLSNI